MIGSPGKVVRAIDDKDLALIQLSIDSYVQKGAEFQGQQVKNDGQK